MNKPNRDSEAIEHTKALRISTADPAGPAKNESVPVIREVPIAIDLEGVEHYTVMCAPLDRKAMAVGFLFSEGVIDGMEDVTQVKICEDNERMVRVRLKDKQPRIQDPGRNLVIVSSCGACGTESMEEKLKSLPKVGNRLRLHGRALRQANRAVFKNQPLFETCGGTHVIGLFDQEGKILASAEDTGRHNALDKAIGKCLLAGQVIAGCGAVLSGRVSFEMVGKCARAGIEVISAVSAPTSLAVDVAERCNITLCAFVRETRATVFSHAERLIDTGD